MLQNENIANAPTLMGEETTNPETMHAIIELTQRYQETTQKYSQGIQNYNLKIEKLKTHIDELSNNKQEYEDIFVKLAHEVKYQVRILANTNDTFHHEIISLEELEMEYKESMKNSEYMKIVKKKKKVLYKLLNSIEEQEEQLFSQELERLNTLEKLTPKRKKVEELTKQLKTLELEKKYFESNQLQHILPSTLNLSTQEVIDIDTLEE